LIIFATVMFTLWWIQRPIKPVVLSASEKATVEEKLKRLGGGDTSARTQAPAANREAKADVGPLEAADASSPKPGSGRTYTPGSKALTLTERELNGLLNLNTELGNAVRLELERDAINAYLTVPIPKDFPIGGGKTFRARGRFRVSLDSGKSAYAVLEDVTVFGLSLPKAWLGGLKGENLIGQAIGERDGSPVLRGIKSLRVEPGALVLEVGD
jgi:hypothetical protein